MTNIVLISGATAGLGRALARAVAARGDIAIGLGRSEAGLTATGEGIDPRRWLGIVADVRDRSAVDHAVAAATAQFGTITAAYANAAVYPRGTITGQDAATALDVFATNVVGVANVVAAVLPAMMRVASGRILVLGSFADIAPLPDSWAYSASKGALHALTRAVAADVRGDYPDILVNEWVPGSLNTQMGIAEGIAPETAASWGLKWIDLPPGGPSGQLFLEDRIFEAPRSLKQKVLGKLGIRR